MSEKEKITGMSFDRNGVMDFFEFIVTDGKESDEQQAMTSKQELEKKLAETEAKMKELWAEKREAK